MIQQPTDVTLKKHGLTSELWREMLDRQGGVCGACGHEPPSSRLNIDHEHIRGYAKMLAEKKREYHRGLLCYMCNKYRLARGSTVENLQGASDYLRRYEFKKLQRKFAGWLEEKRRADDTEAR